MLQIQIFIAQTEVVGLLEQSVLVRSEVELQLRRLCACRVKGGLGRCLVFFQETSAFLHRCAFQCSVGEILMAYHHATEKLILECYPV